jgi:hypothetical protein
MDTIVGTDKRTWEVRVHLQPVCRLPGDTLDTKGVLALDEIGSNLDVLGSPSLRRVRLEVASDSIILWWVLV